jgi:hypothetical protein
MGSRLMGYLVNGINFSQLSKAFLELIQSVNQRGNDHEVEFHEIEIQLFQEVDKLIMRSKFNLFMRSNFFAKLIRRSNRP